MSEELPRGAEPTGCVGVAVAYVQVLDVYDVVEEGSHFPQLPFTPQQPLEVDEALVGLAFLTHLVEVEARLALDLEEWGELEVSVGILKSVFFKNPTFKASSCAAIFP